jgi:hypothetical protein
MERICRTTLPGLINIAHIPIELAQVRPTSPPPVHLRHLDAKASRKRRSIKGLAEFREVRVDPTKAKRK